MVDSIAQEPELALQSIKKAFYLPVTLGYAIYKAFSFQQFHKILQKWGAPTEFFNLPHNYANF